jgi:hypothetical protein
MKTSALGGDCIIQNGQHEPGLYSKYGRGIAVKNPHQWTPELAKQCQIDDLENGRIDEEGN